MSAYIVSENHINVIVSWFVDYRKNNQLWYELNGKYGYMDKAAAGAVARELFAQNVRSVDVRYSEENNSSYVFMYIPHIKLGYGLAEIAGAIDCLEYQSCETDDYHQTDAYKIITAMRKHLLKLVQERDLGDNTTWSIDEIKNTPAQRQLLDRSAYNID